MGMLSKALLVPGWNPGTSLSVDLGRVAALEAQRDELSLADGSSEVARSASRDAEFLLAAAAGCLFLRRRGRKHLGSLGRASEGGVLMVDAGTDKVDAGTDEVRSSRRRVAGGMGSGTQLRRFS